MAAPGSQGIAGKLRARLALRAGTSDGAAAPGAAIVLDPLLAEEVVFHALRDKEARGEGALFERYQRQSDSIYSSTEPSSRKAAFTKLNLKFFARLGFQAVVRETLEEFPRVKEAVAVVALARPTSGSDEGADLRVRGNAARAARPVSAETAEKVVIVRVSPRRFLEDPEDLRTFLRHELLHVDDMLDPAFLHDPRDGSGQGASMEERIKIERYGALWAASIDERMGRMGWRLALAPEARAALLNRVFPGVPAQAVSGFLERNAGRPSHLVLLEAAAEPSILDPGFLRNAGLPGMRRKCPLCGFTYPSDSPASEGIAEEVKELIRADLSSWDGWVCERCLEYYLVRAGLFLAASAKN